MKLIETTFTKCESSNGIIYIYISGENSTAELNDVSFDHCQS
jgi:hypothetical protein